MRVLSPCSNCSHGLAGPNCQLLLLHWHMAPPSKLTKSFFFHHQHVRVEAPIVGILSRLALPQITAIGKIIFPKSSLPLVYCNLFTTMPKGMRSQLHASPSSKCYNTQTMGLHLHLTLARDVDSIICC
jgi:hypothetical protein